MKQIKAFFYIFYKSLTSLEYYKEASTIRLSFAFKYFFVLSLIASVIFSVNTALRFGPEIKKGMESIFASAKDIYPADLEFKIEKGEWFINKPEPFGIPFPKFETDSKTPQPNYLIIFYKEGTINDLASLNSLAILNKANIITQGSNGKIEAYPLADLLKSDMKVTNIEFERFVNQIKELAKVVPTMFYIAATLFWFFYLFVFRAIYLYFVALVLRIIGAVARLGITLNQTMRIAVHTMTLPLVIQVMISIVNFDIGFSWWFILINLVFGVVVMVYLSKEAKAAPAPISQPNQPTV